MSDLKRKRDLTQELPHDGKKEQYILRQKRNRSLEAQQWCNQNVYVEFDDGNRAVFVNARNVRPSAQRLFSIQIGDDGFANTNVEDKDNYLTINVCQYLSAAFWSLQALNGMTVEEWISNPVRVERVRKNVEHSISELCTESNWYSKHINYVLTKDSLNVSKLVCGNNTPLLSFEWDLQKKDWILKKQSPKLSKKMINFVFGNAFDDTDPENKHWKLRSKINTLESQLQERNDELESDEFKHRQALAAVRNVFENERLGHIFPGEGPVGSAHMSWADFPASFPYHKFRFSGLKEINSNNEFVVDTRRKMHRFDLGRDVCFVHGTDDAMEVVSFHVANNLYVARLLVFQKRKESESDVPEFDNFLSIGVLEYVDADKTFISKCDAELKLEEGDDENWFQLMIAKKDNRVFIIIEIRKRARFRAYEFKNNGLVECNKDSLNLNTEAYDISLLHMSSTGIIFCESKRRNNFRSGFGFTWRMRQMDVIFFDGDPVISTTKYSFVIEDEIYHDLRDIAMIRPGQYVAVSAHHHHQGQGLIFRLWYSKDEALTQIAALKSLNNPSIQDVRLASATNNQVTVVITSDSPFQFENAPAIAPREQLPNTNYVQAFTFELTGKV